MADLSPQAQQVFWAFNHATSSRPDDWHYLPAIAAALEAVADQVVPEETDPDPLKAWSVEDWNHMNITRYQREETRRQILAIAAELETFGSTDR